MKEISNLCPHAFEKSEIRGIAVYCSLEKEKLCVATNLSYYTSHSHPDFDVDYSELSSCPNNSHKE